MTEDSVARVLADLVDRLPAVLPTVGLYAAGSLGTRDFQPGRSDVDLVAVLDEPPIEEQISALGRMHKELIREQPAAARLTCLYVAGAMIDDVSWQWPYWADGRMTHSHLTALVRLQLHDHGVVVAGPPLAGQIPYVTPEELIEEIRADLTARWLPITHRRLPWLKDECVDAGLVQLPQARAAINEGVLLSKGQAISQLADFGVPQWIREEMMARHRGWPAPIGWSSRVRRGRIARDAVRRGITQLMEVQS